MIQNNYVLACIWSWWFLLKVMCLLCITCMACICKAIFSKSSFKIYLPSISVSAYYCAMAQHLRLSGTYIQAITEAITSEWCAHTYSLLQKPSLHAEWGAHTHRPLRKRWSTIWPVVVVVEAEWIPWMACWLLVHQ